jgi:hypothetical protein
VISGCFEKEDKSGALLLLTNYSDRLGDSVLILVRWDGRYRKAKIQSSDREIPVEIINGEHTLELPLGPVDTIEFLP